TIDTMPEKTLKAFAEHGKLGASMPADGGLCEQTIAEIRRQGVDIEALAVKLQKDGGDAFAKSWHALLGGLEEKVAKLTATSPS
ncbi:MAG TPA: transaldolase family protein, partial [Burkholderiaceae bacterium]